MVKRFLRVRVMVFNATFNIIHYFSYIMAEGTFEVMTLFKCYGHTDFLALVGH